VLRRSDRHRGRKIIRRRRQQQQRQQKKKKKKKKKKKIKKKEAASQVSSLPSADDLMSSNTLPDFLEAAAKQDKANELARIAEIQAEKHKDEPEPQPGLQPSQPEIPQQRIQDSKQFPTKPYQKNNPIKIDPSKLQASRKRGRSGGPDPFKGLHPWAQGRAASRQKKIKDQQHKKVTRGQTFEGRTWKSEAEMVLRQQYD